MNPTEIVKCACKEKEACNNCPSDWKDIKHFEQEIARLESNTRCICRGWMPGLEKVYIHLSWCPEGYEYQEYLKLPWWKKLFTQNPINNHP